MASKTFNVEKSSSYEPKNGGATKFASKLVCKSVDELLGLENQQTLYLHGNKELSGSIDLDPDMYIIEDRSFIIPDGDNAGDTIQLKTIVGVRPVVVAA